MRKDDLLNEGFTDSEMVLIEEAVRRAATHRSASGADRGAIVEAVVAEARRGTRTLFGLVKVGAGVREAQR